MPFDLDPSYNEVGERIAELKEKHPEARLQPTDPTKPYWLEEIGDHTFVVYSASCYLGPDDKLPGIGVAWEPFPGRTPYTKDSELMNAETSAWGRAIIAALQSSSKKIASAEEVRNRAAEHEEGPRPARPPSEKQLGFLNSLLSQTGIALVELGDVVGRPVTVTGDLTGAEAKALIDHLLKVKDGQPAVTRRTVAVSGDAGPRIAGATEAQHKAIASLQKKAGLTEEEVCVIAQVSKLTDLTKSGASALIDALQTSLSNDPDYAADEKPF